MCNNKFVELSNAFFPSWFHPNLNRHHAEALLIQNGQDGSYLLRQSTTNQGEYSLSVRCANTAKHFAIGWDGTHYTFGMGRFSSLKDFVEHFENKPLIGGESGNCIPPHFLANYAKVSFPNPKMPLPNP